MRRRVMMSSHTLDTLIGVAFWLTLFLLICAVPF
jgi:hypothetical protein